MIVVIGSPSGRQHPRGVRAAGMAASIAIAATHGRAVQLVGRIGDDAVADAVLRDLAGHGVGHVAVLRDAAHPTAVASTDADEGGAGVLGRPELEPEDVGLALRYLTDFAVVAVVGPSRAILDVVERAASWGAAALVVVEPRPNEGETPDTGSTTGSRLGPSASETGEAFAARVGELLARLDKAAESVRPAR